MENNKVNGCQQEMLELIIKELLEEHAKTNHIVGDLSDKISGITKRFEEPTVQTVTEPDIKRIQQNN